MKKLIKTKLNSQGLTVLELLAALTLLTLIIGGGFTVMAHGNKLFNTTTETTDIRYSQKFDMEVTGADQEIVSNIVVPPRECVDNNCNELPTVIPPTPDNNYDASTTWFNGNSHKITNTTDTKNVPVKLKAGNGQPIAKTTPNDKPNFTAPEIHWYNGIDIASKSSLTLNTNLLVLHNTVTLEKKNSGAGSLKLNLDSNSIENAFTSSDIKRLLPKANPLTNTSYGIMYVKKSIKHGNNTILNSGIYFYPNNTTLPADIDKLIRYGDITN